MRNRRASARARGERPQTPHRATARRAPRGRAVAVVLILLLALYGVVLVRTAWVCDDAYITFRTVDNFANGYGLRWNVQDRVQTYTHPLWMLLMSLLYSVGHEIFLTSIWVSIALSVAAAVVALFVPGLAKRAGVVLLTALLFSKAFIDFSTSGMENPLTHLIMAAFLVVLLRSGPDARTIFLLSLVAALGGLNRMDMLLLVAPAILVVLLEVRTRKGMAAAAIGFIPLLLWELFSLVYYGAPFPNTAYAKLNTGIAGSELARQGLRYLQDSLTVDPLTGLAIMMGLALPIVARNKRLIPVSAGILLYLGYVVAIGGDFMSGRFLTLPFFAASILGAMALGRWLHSDRRAFLAAGAIAALGIMSPDPPLLSGAAYGALGFRIEHGIEDARAYYYPTANLLGSRSGSPMPRRDLVELGRETRQWAAPLPEGRYGYAARASIGYFGFYCGPRVHVIDRYGLADALLARLPVDDGSSWRTGHFMRELPEGYRETLGSGQNRIADQDLAAYYEVLESVIRAPLFDGERLKNVVMLNLGRHNSLIAAYAARLREGGAGAGGTGP